MCSYQAAWVAQLVERQAFNLNVQGSSPCSGDVIVFFIVLSLKLFIWLYYYFFVLRFLRVQKISSEIKISSWESSNRNVAYHIELEYLKQLFQEEWCFALL